MIIDKGAHPKLKWR